MAVVLLPLLNVCAYVTEDGVKFLLVKRVIVAWCDNSGGAQHMSHIMFVACNTKLWPAVSILLCSLCFAVLVNSLWYYSSVSISVQEFYQYVLHLKTCSIIDMLVLKCIVSMVLYIAFSFNCTTFVKACLRSSAAASNKTAVFVWRFKWRILKSWEILQRERQSSYRKLNKTT